MAAKKTKKVEKQSRPCRIFCGDQSMHEAEYEGDGKMRTMFHDEAVREQNEISLSKRLTEAVRTILAENPDSGLAQFFEV